MAKFVKIIEMTDYPDNGRQAENEIENSIMIPI